jgi:hypothetical protein
VDRNSSLHPLTNMCPLQKRKGKAATTSLALSLSLSLPAFLSLLRLSSFFISFLRPPFAVSVIAQSESARERNRREAYAAQKHSSEHRKQKRFNVVVWLPFMGDVVENVSSALSNCAAAPAHPA